MAPKISLYSGIIAYALSIIGSAEEKENEDSKVLLFIPYYYLFVKKKINVFYKISLWLVIIILILLISFFLFINYMTP